MGPGGRWFESSHPDCVRSSARQSAGLWPRRSPVQIRSHTLVISILDCRIIGYIDIAASVAARHDGLVPAVWVIVGERLPGSCIASFASRDRSEGNPSPRRGCRLWSNPRGDTLMRKSGRVAEGNGFENRRVSAPGVRIPPLPPCSRPNRQGLTHFRIELRFS